MLLAQPGNARRGLCLPAAADADIPEIAKKRDRLVVLLGLLGGNEGIQVSPGLGLAFRQRRELAEARRAGALLVAVV